MVMVSVDTSLACILGPPNWCRAPYGQFIQENSLCNEQPVAYCAGSAAQLAAVASASGPEKENLAEGASAMVTAALRLQPLLARAQKLRTRDQAMSLTSAKNRCGEVSNVYQLFRHLEMTIVNCTFEITWQHLLL